MLRFLNRILLRVEQVLQGSGSGAWHRVWPCGGHVELWVHSLWAYSWKSAISCQRWKWTARIFSGNTWRDSLIHAIVSQEVQTIFQARLKRRKLFDTVSKELHGTWPTNASFINNLSIAGRESWYSHSRFHQQMLSSGTWRPINASSCSSPCLAYRYMTFNKSRRHVKSKDSILNFPPRF